MVGQATISLFYGCKCLFSRGSKLGCGRWGEPVCDFIACLERHAELRGLGEDTVYWVCAYANNQHELGADLGDDPRKSSFYKALRQVKGVVVVLDPLATPSAQVEFDCAAELDQFMHAVAVALACSGGVDDA